MAKRILKYFLWFLAVMAVLIVLAVGFAFSPPVQTYVVKRVLTGINEGLNGSIAFHRVRVSLTGKVVLDSARIMDPEGKVIAAMDELRLRVDPLAALRKNTIHLYSLTASGMVADIVIDTTGINLLHAVAPRDTTKPKPIDTTAAEPKPWIIRVDEAEIHGGHTIFRSPDSLLFEAEAWNLDFRGRFGNDSLDYDVAFDIPEQMSLATNGAMIMDSTIRHALGKARLHVDSTFAARWAPQAAAAGSVDLDLNYQTERDSLAARANVMGTSLGRVHAYLVTPFPLQGIAGRGEVVLDTLTPSALWADTTAMVVSGLIRFTKQATESALDGWHALLQLEASNYGRYKLSTTDLTITVRDTVATMKGDLDTGHGRARIDAVARGLNPETMHLVAAIDLFEVDAAKIVESVPKELAPLNGQIHLDVASLDPDRMRAEANLDFHSIVYGTYALDRLIFQGAINGQQFRVDTLIAAYDTAIVGFRAEGSLEGEARYWVRGEIPDFTAMQVALEDVLPPLDTLIEGSAALDLAGTGQIHNYSISQLTAHGMLELHKARYGKHYIEFASIALDSMLLDSLYFEGQVLARHGESSGQILDSLMMTMRGTPTRIAADLEAWANSDTIYVNSEFVLERTPERMTLLLDSLQGRYREISAQLEAPASVALAKDRIEVGGFALASEVGVLRASGYVQRQGDQDLTLELSALNTGEVGRLLDKPVPESNTNIRLQLYGTEQNLTGEVAILAQEVRQEDTPLADEIWLHAIVDSRHALVDGLIIWLGDTTVILEGELPARISFKEGFVLADSLPIAGRLQLLEQPLAKLERYMSPGMTLGGYLSADVQFTGTVAAPDWAGTFALRDGTYRDTRLGLDYRDMDIRGEMVGDTLRIPSFDINSGRRGTLDGSGWAVMAFPLPSELHLDLNFDNFEAVDNQDMAARMSGQMGINGPLDRLNADGNIRVSAGEYRVSTSASKSLEEIDLDREMGIAPEDTAAGPALSPAQIYRWMAHALHLDIPGNVWIRGSGLNLELYGEMWLYKDRNYDPTLNGDINVRRGTVQFLGLEFRVTEGVVRFDGPISDPNLEITAEREQDDGTTYAVSVTGSLNDMQIALSGTGATGDTLTSAQVLQAATIGEFGGSGTSSTEGSRASQVKSAAASVAAGQLTGLIGGFAGLDIFKFRSGEAGSGEGLLTGSLEVGTYVTDRLFVRVLQPIRSEQSGQEVSLEYRLLEWLKIRAQQAADGSSALDLLFQVDWR